MPSTIFLNQPVTAIFREAVCKAATPVGSVVHVDANGELALGFSEVLTVATEINGRASGGSVDQTYAAGETAQYGVPQRGEYLNLKVAAGAAAITVGELLEAKTDGSVGAVTIGTAVVIAREAVDNSAGSEQVFLKVEVI